MNNQYVIPQTMRAVVLDGAGFEHLTVRSVPTPRPGPRQLLARVDAAGICTSVIKLVEQGPAHSYLYGWDLARFPLILGDEGSVTLVAIGEELQGRYTIGQRYVVQPAVDHAPINHRERYENGARNVRKIVAGYTLPGHLAEYMLIPEEVLEAGCLLPVPAGDFPYAHAALGEPISCVISAQEHHMHIEQSDAMCARTAVKGVKRGGVTVVVGAGAMGRMHVDCAFSYRPRAIVVSETLDNRLEIVRRLFAARAAALGTELVLVNPVRSSLATEVERITGGAGADDVIVAAGSRAAIESSQHLVGRGGVLNLFGGLKKGEDSIRLDAGIIHYREINVTGSSGGSPWDVARALELMAAKHIDAGLHIARIGDLEHTAEFLRLIKEQALNGKAVVYPHRRTRHMREVCSWSAEDERAHFASSESEQSAGD